MEEKYRKKLSRWKKQYISKRERLTLIRSTLSSLQIYFMFLFVIPIKVRMKLENIQRDFLWEGGTLENKPHFVRCSTICTDKRNESLGIRSLSLPN